MAKKQTKSKIYVISRASQDIEYCGWKTTKTGINEKSFSVVIKGGANIMNRDTMKTPKGVITEISQEELDFLNQNGAFLRHKKAGFMIVTKDRDEADDIKSKAGKKDNSAQLTPQDFKDAGQTPPKTK